MWSAGENVTEHFRPPEGGEMVLKGMTGMINPFLRTSGWNAGLNKTPENQLLQVKNKINLRLHLYDAMCLFW